MADSPVENPGIPDYPHEMETRVAILEHSTAELKFEIREVKAMVRDLTNTVLAKFDATDKSIADMRVEMQAIRTDLTGSIQSVRTEIQSVRAEFESKIGSARNQIFTLIVSVTAVTIAAIGLLVTFH